MIGSAQAPIVLELALEYGCPSCHRYWQELVSLRNTIIDGRVELQIYLTAQAKKKQDRRLAIAVASAIFAASCKSQSDMLDLMDQIFVIPVEPVPEYISDVMNGDGPKRGLELHDLLSKHRSAIAERLEIAHSLLSKRGITSTPVSWLSKRNSETTSQQFDGFTANAKLRLSISKLLRSQ